VAGGALPPQEMLRQLGYDPDKVFKEYEEFNTLAKEKGLVFSSDFSQVLKQNSATAKEEKQSDKGE